MKTRSPVFCCLFGFLALCALWSCQVQEGNARVESASPQEELVRLDSRTGWEARLLWSSDCGVWTVELFDVIPPCAGTEVIALDDKGRCVLLSLNASRVSLWQPLMDGQWLGGIFHEEIDPATSGPELYVGGKRGNLYQVVPLPQGGFNTQVISYFPGKEIHTLIAADLVETVPGKELYAGLITGELYRIDPPSTLSHREWKSVLVHEDPGRIRDAVVLSSAKEKTVSLVYVSRSGRVVRLHPGPAGLTEEELYRCPQGLARIDQGRTGEGEVVLYVVGDDGQVMGLQKQKQGGWVKELVYPGSLGARGVAKGRFDENAEKEILAIFGYSGNVELLRREASGSWTAETVFTDLDKGHWLCTGELDDRNGTDEIVVSGYAGRVVLLSRPPGFGLKK